MSLVLLVGESHLAAQQVSRSSDEEQPPKINVFDSTGIELKSSDSRYAMHLWFRGQFRYSYPFDDGLTTAEGFEQPAKSSFDVRRARIKLKGNIYRPWLKYYFEHDFVTISSWICDSQSRNLGGSCFELANGK
jgi:hypothetical protein